MNIKSAIMQLLKAIWNSLQKLWAPLPSAVAGRINWQEALLAAALGGVFFLAGGSIESLIKLVAVTLGLGDNASHGQVIAAVVAFIVSLLYRNEQGK